MSANEYQQSLLDAMQLLSSNAVSTSDSTKVIKAVVVEEIDEGIHQYKVTYGGATYTDVYGINASYYAPNTVVYVLIPDGNFDNSKLLMGSVSPNATEEVSEELSDIYIPSGDNLIIGTNSLDLQSWTNIEEEVNIDKSYFNKYFREYLENHKNFLFSALVKTEIDVNHQSSGNYGLKLELPFKDSKTGEEITKIFYMDVNTMQGNPYSFDVYQLVELYYEIEDNLEYDTSNGRSPKLWKFVTGFGYTTPPADSDDKYDIHFKNISFESVDVLTDEQKNGYYLAIVSNNGKYFADNDYSESKILTPVLKVKGKTTKITSWDCYWFVEDASITTESDGYLSLGGLGWRCLNEKTNITHNEEGKETFQYNVNKRTYTVTPDDVLYRLKYKCVLTRGETVVVGTIQLKNLKSNIQTQLISATGSNTFIEGIGSVRLIARIYYPDFDPLKDQLTYEWQRFDKNYNYLDKDFYEISRYNELQSDGYYETEIFYPCSELEKINTINCTFYCTTLKNGQRVQSNLGTEAIVVTTSNEYIYTIKINGGDVLYKYDADGDSPLVSTYDGPLSSKISTLQPIGYQVYKADGTELTQEEYLYCRYTWKFPKNSMMKLSNSYSSEDDDYYYVTGTNNTTLLNYTIENTFSKKKNNNTIILNVEFEDNILASEVSPKFLKDGESGTNGTKYSAYITYDGYGYGERDTNGKIRKLQCILQVASRTSTTGTWYVYNLSNNSLVRFNNPTFKVRVYKDGELDTPRSIQWEMFDNTYANTSFNIDSSSGTLSIRTNDWSLSTGQEHYNVVRAKIGVPDKGETGGEEYIYAYYPIEITRILTSTYSSTKVVPTIDGGFSEVLYESDGTNPNNSGEAFICLDSLYNEALDEYIYVWNTSTNLKITKTEGSQATIKPVTKFDNGDSRNFVKATLTLNAAKRTEIQNKINNYTSQKDEASSKITSLTSEKNNVLDLAKKFSYNNKKEELDAIKDLLNYRKLLLDDVTELITIFNKIKTLEIKYNFKYLSKKIDEEKLQEIYKNIYLLGTSSTYSLDKIEDLSQYIMKDSDFDNEYLSNPKDSMITYYAKAQNYLWRWNLFIDKYTEVRTTILTLTTQYTKLYNFDQDLFNLAEHNTPLDNLIYIATFNNLKQQLISLVNKLRNSKDTLTSYNTIDNDLLIPIKNLFAIYQNIDYQDGYYTDAINSQQAIVDDCDKNLDQLNESLLPTATDSIVHIRPIIMLYNRYELSSLNGWDGNKLYIDEDNQQYLLAPQIGAGAKNDDNSFTGFVMGVKSFNNSTSYDIGLFGYDTGIRSLFLNAKDGSAIFGKSGKAQIIIDPRDNKGLIYNSGYFDNNDFDDDGKIRNTSKIGKGTHGILINLVDSYIHLGEEQGKIYSYQHNTFDSGKGFYLGPEGLSVIGETTSGTSKIAIKVNGNPEIYSGGHNSLDSKKRGFYLGENGLSICNENRSRIELSTQGDPIIYSGEHSELGSSKDGFFLSNDGLSIGKNFYVRVIPNQNSAIVRIGKNAYNETGWDSHLCWRFALTEDPGMDEVYYFSNVNSSSGNLGSVYETTIKGTKFYTADIYGKKGDIYIGSDGVYIGRNFTITDDGLVGTKVIVADQGRIGSWRLTKKGLYGIPGGVDDPDSSEPYIKIEPDGDITAVNTGLKDVWTLKHDGTGNIGGTYKTRTGTYYSAGPYGYPVTDSKSNGIFREDCYEEINLIARERGKTAAKDAISDGLKEGGDIYNKIIALIPDIPDLSNYVTKGTYSGTINTEAGTCSITFQ